MKKFIVTLIIGMSAAQLMSSEKQNDSAVVGESKAAVPVALIGVWQSGSIAPVNFYDANKQQWNAPNGRGMFLIVQANGQYRFGVGEQITYTDYFTYEEGVVANYGAEIVLAPKMGSKYTRDICVHTEEQQAMSKLELSNSTLKFQINSTPSGPRFVLTNEFGESITLQLKTQ